MRTGEWLPKETLDEISEYLIAIKGPLTTPVGGGIRSLNVALRQELDLFVCLRPVRWFEGVPSPVKRPQDTDMVIFRENTEDIYAGIEYEKGTEAVEAPFRDRREWTCTYGLDGMSACSLSLQRVAGCCPRPVSLPECAMACRGSGRRRSSP